MAIEGRTRVPPGGLDEGCSAFPTLEEALGVVPIATALGVEKSRAAFLLDVSFTLR